MHCLMAFMESPTDRIKPPCTDNKQHHHGKVPFVSVYLSSHTLEFHPQIEPLGIA